MDIIPEPPKKGNKGISPAILNCCYHQSLFPAIYDIRKSDPAKLFRNTIVDVGTISTAAKAAISALKAIPGIGVATSDINAVIASCIASTLGERSIYVFEQIYLGNKDFSNVDWIRKILESRFTESFVDKLKVVLESVTDSADKKDIAKQIYDIFVQGISKKISAGKIE